MNLQELKFADMHMTMAEKVGHHFQNLGDILKNQENMKENSEIRLRSGSLPYKLRLGRCTIICTCIPPP